MEELFRNVVITYCDMTGESIKLYANVSEGQYEILVNREDHLRGLASGEQIISSIYAQLTPEGDISPRMIALHRVDGVDFWEPGPESGLAREWPWKV